MIRPLSPQARDWALLVARVVVGVVMFAHGYQKLLINGISGTMGYFENWGIPLAIASASFVALVEFAGGILLIAGALTPVVCGLMLFIMIGAAGYVHIQNGIFVGDGGWELVGVIGAATLAFMAVGPGRFSVDHLLSRGGEQPRESEPVPAAAPTPPPTRPLPETSDNLFGSGN